MSEKITKIKNEMNSVLDKLDSILDKTNKVTSNVNSAVENFSSSMVQFGDNIEKLNNIADKSIQLFSQYNESKRIDLEMQQLQNDLVNIVSNHKENMSIINNVFLERRNVIDKLFNVIDKGILQNNDQVVFMSMNLINATLERNPLLMLQQYKKSNNEIDFSNNKPLELDF